MRTSLRALAVVIVAIGCLPAFAGKLADLPWDDKIPQSVRSGVRAALQKEAGDVADKKNEQGKNYIRVYQSAAVEPQPDGKVFGYMTIQRCLADKMVTERWRYTLEKQGNDYEILARDKLAESSDALLVMTEPAEKARPLAPFTFTHDLLTLKLDRGSYVLGLWGAKPNALLVAGSGHLTLTPVDDYEAMFYDRQLGAKSIDAAVTEVQFEFHPDDQQFLKLAGYVSPSEAAGKGTGGAAGGGDLGGLKDLVDDRTQLTRGKEFTPYMYAPPPQPQEKGAFTLRMKTDKFGWLVYQYDPNSVKEIALLKERGGLSLRRTDKEGSKLVSMYYAPETRALPMARREARRGLRLLDVIHADGQFDIDSEKFTATVSGEVTLLEDTNEMFFDLAGNPTVRYVRLDDGSDLLAIPFPNLFSSMFGFSETTNAFRVVLPRTYKAGERVGITISYDSPKMVTMIDAGFWYIERGGFLPAAGAALAEPTYLRFVMRTPDAYTHISIGSKLSEEVKDGFRYTEWGADHGFNFPTMIIGKYYEPIVMTAQTSAGPVKVTGYQTRSQEEYELTDKALAPQVEEATRALELYNKLFLVPYPFKDLKLVGTPLQFSWSQAPSSLLYIGQIWMWPEARVATWMNENPGRLRGSTSHETAHQWWGGMVSNVSQLQYWWVEVLPELSSAFYRELVARDPGGLKSKLDDWRERGMAGDWQCSLPDFYRAENWLGSMIYYTKGPAVFWMLREYYGKDKLLQFMRNLAVLHAGDLLSTSDLQDVAEKTFNEKMDWFFDEYIRGIGIPQVRYKFDDPRPAEDGKGWIITGKLAQQIMVKGDPAPGKVFKHLLVPIVVPTEKGPEKVKEFMDEAEKDVRIRVESKPNGALKVNDQNVVYMTVKEM